MKKIYCVPKLEELDQYLTFAEENQAGFEYNDFFWPAVLDDVCECRRRMDCYKSLKRDRSEDTLHGAFFDICVSSSDSLIYQASDRRVRQSMDIAMELGVQKVIFHTNYITNFRVPSYMDGWVDANERYWKQLLQDYPDLQICMENMFDETPYLLEQLALRMQDEPRFCVCFDWAHAFLGTESLEEWYLKLAPFVGHMHLNDNNGHSDEHRAVGDGEIPWEIYRKYRQQLEERKPTVLIEVSDLAGLKKSVRYMKERGMYPF